MQSQKATYIETKGVMNYKSKAPNKSFQKRWTDI